MFMMVCVVFVGAFLYNGCGNKYIAAAAATDYISRRAEAINSCKNSTQYWPGRFSFGNLFPVGTLTAYFHFLPDDCWNSSKDLINK